MELMALQFSYVLLGVMMNLMSLRHYRNTGKYYTPTRPGAGLVIMALYGLSLLLGLLESQWPFRLAMTVFVVILAAGGVIKHMVTGSSGQYASPGTRWTAVVINAYGVVLSVLALTASFVSVPGG